MTPAPDLFASATEQLAALAAGTTSSVELLDAYLRQIDDHSWVNAVVTVDAERAREEAVTADRVRAEGRSLGPLHGLPITIKHDVEVAGMPSTYGALVNRDHVGERDATAVARLRRAGAIVFGRSNLPEFASDGQSYNELHGTTANPWDRARTPGGSSGGSAAAVAGGMTALELGSDMGGSIRLPASWCGVHGLKPTWGVVPLDGEAPVPDQPADVELAPTAVAVAGPLARGAADLELALSVLAASGDALPLGPRVTLPPAPFQTHRELRALAWLDDATLPTDPATRAVLDAAVEALAADGVQVTYAERPPVDLDRLGELFELLFMADFGGTFSEQTYAAVVAGMEAAAGRAPLAALHLRALRLSHREWHALERERLRVLARWEELFADVDVLLCPTVFTTAIEHDHSEPVELRTIAVDGATRSHRPDLTRWCAPVSVSSLPATTAPAGLTAAGLPVGLQIVAAAYRDRSTIAAARLLEQTLGGFTAPPLVAAT